MMAHSIKPRIMYIERKAGELTGEGRIGRVTSNRTANTLFYSGKAFARTQGFKSNYVCVDTGEDYRISGPKRRGGNSLYPTNITTKIDDDVREEYRTEIRRQPERINEAETL